MFSLSCSMDLTPRQAHNPGIDRERIADILHARHRVIAERALMALPPTVRQLVEDDIPVLAQLAVQGDGSQSQEEDALIRFFDAGSETLDLL